MISWRLLTLLPLVSFTASQCPVGEQPCGSVCVKICDGKVDCPDRSDETFQLCATRVCKSNDANTGVLGDFVNYSSEKFKCDYGGCIVSGRVCNGHPDCWDQSDETHELCSSTVCRKRHFKCDYGGCIRSVWVCNGNANCLDGSDETEDACRSKRCRSSQFQCDYGACIDGQEKCDGKPDCVDNSDESTKTCGPDHTTRAPLEVSPTPSKPTPPPVTSSPKPDIIFGENTTSAGDWCLTQGLCACPKPKEHFCVPCKSIQSCPLLGDGAVCSINSAGGPNANVKVEVLTCGIRPVISFAEFVRNHETFYCGSSDGVPAESVILASCWGTNFLAQCQPDGTWRTYLGGPDASTPTASLCQFQEINSPVCGKRPRYEKPPGGFTTLTVLPHWPWLVGLTKDGKYFCAATIISPHYLLTAGHCIVRTPERREILDPRDVKAQLVNSEGGIIRVRISQIHLYPQYVPGTRASHDVALIRMEKEIIYSHQLYPACVNTEAFPQQKIAATFNRTTDYFGWEMIIQQHDSRCHSPQDRCATTLGIDSQQFCAIDTEHLRHLPKGSSGGPYLVNVGNDVEEHWVVAGIVSSLYQETDCSDPFTIFTSITTYWPWISKCVHEGVCN